MVWEMFSKKLQGLIKSRGFDRPTAVQEEGIPVIFRGENALLLAPTGLGKTESCLLPIFDRLAEGEHKPISVLYITPLRSLNRDLLKRILWWANNLGFEVSVRHGDTTQYERSMQAENPPAMLISTPETLQALLAGKVMRRHLANIRWIVIDEAHELVSNKRGVQLSVGLERLKELIKNHGTHEPQIIGLSATVGSPEAVAQFIAAGRPCRIINTMGKSGMNLRVESPNPGKEDFEKSQEIYAGPPATARLRRIEQLIKEKKSVLVFTNTRESAEILSSRLGVLDKDLPIETHHSSLSRDVRIRAEEGFKKGEIKSLVCTSSLELGIDIGLIDFILQYMSPRQVVKILQRVGRSNHTTTGVSDGVVISSEPDDCFESAVIASLALRGEIEPTRIYPKSLDVLGHQVVGLSLEEYRIPFERAYSIIKGAWPYRELGREEFLDVCRLMQRLGFIWLGNKDSEAGDRKKAEEKPGGLVIKRRKRAWEYYFQNMSTIPDTKNYQIFDVVSNQPVGTLDAEFIALHGDIGTSFICKGRAWRILELKGSKVMVEPVGGIEAAIPAWEGELIPVPFAVAQGVGALRAEIAGMLDKPRNEIIEHLVKRYPITADVAKKLYSLIKKQAEWGFVPDDKNILVEHFDSGGETCVIIHACFGSLINDTLGRALSALLTAKLGSVGLQTDPCRIVIRLQSRGWEEVADLFRSLDPGAVEPVLKLSLPNTELFRWRFLHVARRLGIISRDADFGTGYLKKIVESYKDTPPHREAMSEVFTEKLDIGGAVNALGMMRSGKTRLEVRQGLSPLGGLGLEKRFEIVAPKKPDMEIFGAFKDRLMETKVRLICCKCGWAITYTVKNLPDDIHCAQCQAKLMGVIKPYEFDKEILLNKHVRKRPLTKKEMNEVDAVIDTASLVIASGRDAVIVLAGRGIGPRAAKRVLRRLGRGDALLQEILQAEQQYARTKMFWKEQ
jgi:ATP-dependent Lhr-like helicase